MPNFFLSSAVGDDDPYVVEFFHDLSREVARSGGASGDNPYLGAASSDQRAWPPDMAHSLGNCDVFVALCSRRYFLNDACGRQWQVFEERVRQYEQRSGARPPVLIALTWTADADTVGTVGEMLGPMPARPRQGLRQLARLRSLRDVYQALVVELAKEIVTDARTYRLPRLDPPPFVAVANAFDRPRPAGGTVGRSGLHVHFVVLAGTRAEMASVRENLTYYGSTRDDWTPYLPAIVESIAERARSVAADHLFESEVGSTDDVLDRIERAHRNDEIVVVVVDGWATQLEGYQRMLVEIDRRGLGDAAVLVPASKVDEETVKNRDELRYGLRWALRNSVGRPEALLRTEIETPDRFDVELAGVMEEARNRIFREGRVRHLPSGEAPGERPILRGP